MSRDAFAWVVRRALRVAVGTCVLALIVATTLSGAGAERFATVAYLAAIFAAGALIAGRFLGPAPQDYRPAAPPFPVLLSYTVGVAVCLSVAGALVSQPGAEFVVLFLCVALVFVVVLAKCGTLTALNSVLVRGGVVAAAIRYAAVVTICLLGLAALSQSYTAEAAAKLGYRIAIAAAVLIAASLIAPTKFGLRIRESGVRLGELVDRQARALAFERTATYAAIAAILAIVLAGVLPAPYSEPFAILTYLAALSSAFGVAMECRRLRS